MSDFKAGDDVLCVQTWDTLERQAIFEGQVYKVSGLGNNGLFLEGLGEFSYNSKKFKKLSDKKRPHYDLIIAWANGADIQVKEIGSGRWLDRENPQFAEHLKYRIKPEKTEKDLKIEELQKKAKEIQEELEKLKGED